MEAELPKTFQTEVDGGADMGLLQPVCRASSETEKEHFSHQVETGQIGIFDGGTRVCCCRQIEFTQVISMMICITFASIMHRRGHSSLDGGC